MGKTSAKSVRRVAKSTSRGRKAAKVAPARAAGLVYEDVPVGDLATMMAEYNPRKISAHDMAALRRSLRRFGAVEPVVVNRRTRRLVGGHQRVLAAEAEGIAALPVAYVELDQALEELAGDGLPRGSGGKRGHRSAPLAPLPTRRTR